MDGEYLLEWSKGAVFKSTKCVEEEFYFVISFCKRNRDLTDEKLW
jgi:hypothetical protein